MAELIPATPRERDLLAQALGNIERAQREGQLLTAMFFASHGLADGTVMGVTEAGVMVQRVGQEEPENAVPSSSPA
jgi:hypothetical protein